MDVTKFLPILILFLAYNITMMLMFMEYVSIFMIWIMLVLFGCLFLSIKEERDRKR